MSESRPQSGEEPGPTRSPHQLGEDEGPQSIGELKAALALWPQHLMAFTAELEAAPFAEVLSVVTAHRVRWMMLTHPEIQAAIAESEGGTSDTIPSETVWADYDPVTFEPLHPTGQPGTAEGREA
ncbi:hypothetical protein [Streptomyces albipurpureus]|uniref:Uncharacterized protein n=1 Tax=Streptomyces albipurpureus TaxID=2897419 RepID=A0ABT0V280_9ACTN|nr:hypothetical protein [Streptomyces sp. CWNU-1]MCM2394314.1 hypothetical protein [Streptomyces sp. CWNU-1]